MTNTQKPIYPLSKGGNNTFTGTNTFTQDITSPNINGTPTETATLIQSKGGALICIDSSNAVNLMRTTDGYVGNTETTGIRAAVSAATVSVGIVDLHPFQNSKNAVRFDCTVNTASYPAIRNFGGGSTPGATWGIEQMKKFGRPVNSNTKYKISIPVNISITSGSSFKIGLVGYSNSGIRGMNVESVLTTGVNTYEFTTGVNDTYLLWAFFYNTGTTGSVYLDWNNFKNQEVNEIVTNSIKSNTSALLGFTSVGDTDGIDLSLDPTGSYTNTYTLGTTIVESATTQQDFVGNKTKSMKIGIYITSKGTGDYTLTVHDSTNTIITSQTITNANLVVGLNYFTVSYDYVFNSAYHFHITSTVADGAIKCQTTGDMNTCSYILTYYRPCTNFCSKLHRDEINIKTDVDGFLDGVKLSLENSTFSFKEDFTNLLYLRNYTISGSDLICKINIPGKIISGTFISDKTLTYSTDSTNFSASIPIGVKTLYVKIANYSGITSFSFNLNINIGGIQKMYYQPTNTPIYHTYSGLKLDTATTIVIYRATKYGFPALEYGDGSYQLLDIDCSASTSTVQLSEDGVTYVTKTDGQSLTIASTTTPIIYTKITITSNRLYLSSNDYNYDFNKDGSSMQNVLVSTIIQGNKYELEILQRGFNQQAITLADILTNINTVGATVATDGTGTYNGNNELPLQQALLIGGYIKVKKGVYNINSALRIKGNTVLDFEPGAVLKAKANMDFKLLENVNNSGYGTTIIDKNIALIGIEIDGGSTTNISDTKRGITMSSVERLYIDRAYVYGVGIGDLSKTTGCQLAYCNNFNVTNSTFNANGHYGINIYGGYNGHFNNIHTELNGRHGFTFIGSQSMTLNNLTSIGNAVNASANGGNDLYLRGLCNNITMNNIVIDGLSNGLTDGHHCIYISPNSSDEIAQLVGIPTNITINNLDIKNALGHGVLIDSTTGKVNQNIKIDNFTIKNCTLSGIACQGEKCIFTNGYLEKITLSGISLNYDGGSINTQCTISNITGKNIGLSLVDCNTNHNQISNINGEDCSQTTTNTYPVVYINGDYNTINGVIYKKTGTNIVDYIVKEGVGRNYNSIGGLTSILTDVGVGRLLTSGAGTVSYGIIIL